MYRFKVAAGGQIFEVGIKEEENETIVTYRVFINDNTRCLNMARSIGDHKISTHTQTGLRCIIPNPKTTRYFFNDYKNGFLILASDGFWEAISTNQLEEVIKELRTQCHEGIFGISSVLVKGALEADSTDNITIMLIKL